MTETNQSLPAILAPRRAGRTFRDTRRKHIPLTPPPAQATAPAPRLDAYPAPAKNLTDILLPDTPAQDIAR